MKTLIINHLLDSINKELNGEWWATYLDLLFQLAEQRAQESEEASTEESELDLIDESLRPLIQDLHLIFDHMNNQILENNNRILQDIQTAAVQGMDRSALEQVIRSLPQVPETANALSINRGSLYPVSVSSPVNSNGNALGNNTGSSPTNTDLPNSFNGGNGNTLGNNTGSSSTNTDLPNSFNGVNGNTLGNNTGSLSKGSIPANSLNGANGNTLGNFTGSLPDSKAADALQNINQENFEASIESQPNVSETVNTMKNIDRNIAETLKESLPEDHTLPSPETINVLKEAQRNGENSES
ncbi:hypothetical protein ACH95_09705 [Bacillus glycinifermentans]|uniref:hypothetical protein n=1 Tax=Bacillus glycinifermentans TaxID=1664069 RepID=UPI0006529CE1|nr:hypothetical protein [Bacillus glycinifermentans]KMM60071.1 hypothetical protein ACH95_09705 [Bacillus glycinifermentans]MEC0494874.1 hypothetical protein [Bacillus glycinifermentans]MEC0540982.1 hypothetical protein [Bacillus glycinifermentans]